MSLLSQGTLRDKAEATKKWIKALEDLNTMSEAQEA